MKSIDSILMTIESASSESELSDNLAILEAEITHILLAIKSCESIQGANDYFQALDEAQTTLAKLIFKKGAAVTPNLREFVRDFDRIDDTDMRTYLFDKIKRGEYFLLRTSEN